MPANELLNPSFEDLPSVGWGTNGNASLTRAEFDEHLTFTDNPRHGQWFGQLTTTAVFGGTVQCWTEPVPAVPGEVWSGRIYTRRHTGNKRNVRMLLRFKKADNAMITQHELIQMSDDVWLEQKIENVVAPDLTASVDLWFAIGSTDNGDRHHLDAAFLGRGDHVEPLNKHMHIGEGDLWSLDLLGVVNESGGLTHAELLTSI